MGLRRPWSSSSLKNWALLVLSLSVSSLWWAGESSTADIDIDALGALQQAWGQNALSVLQWNGNDPCASKWIGILCDTSSPQRVTSIQLSGLGLLGNLPSDIHLLSALQTLDLSNNNLTESIPSQIGQLTQLGSLDLQFNFFEGEIPRQIGQLKNLAYLSLNGNRLTGGIPNEIGLLSKLVWLDVGQNSLDGLLPFSSDGNSIVHAGLDNLTSAGHFHLNNNRFSGSIPQSLCHPGMSLIHLLLDSNGLTGTIPGELGFCSSLKILKLNNNLLGDVIPDQIGQIPNLTQLQLSDNQLVSPLPNLSNLTNLLVLDLSSNLLDEDFPLWMPCLQNLTDLNMQSASVRGQIPPSFFQLPALSRVKLSNNKINGTLDISKASRQLLLVAMENNNISTLISGNYNNVLRLQNNPVCKNANSAKVCSDNSSASAPTSYLWNTCLNTCRSGFQVNPLQCTCTIPYEGILTYRAPQFTSLSSDTLFPILLTTLAKSLFVDERQVEVPSSAFNAQNQLLVVISIFPSGSAVGWNPEDVIRLATILGKSGGVSPQGFGPAMFRQYPYEYPYIKLVPSGKSSTAAKKGIAVGVSVLVLVILAVGCFACLQKRRADKAVQLSQPFASWRPRGKDSGGAPKLMGARFFSYAELKKATSNFNENNEVGFGGFGKVYRGILSSGEQVAVKRAEVKSMQGATEFKNEIELLSRVHHKNVVGLVGFCFEQGEQMLVYEYMAGGCLRDCLMGRSGFKLDWRQRLMVALGSARGITYLHEMVHPPIIHRDIKSANILLDEKKIVKVADFGLSKIGPDGSGKRHVSTQVKGTLGYLDPEYYLSQQLTEKSDVYSYGVVLLELLTAKAPIEHGKYVVKEAKAAIDRGGLGELRTMLDPRIRDEELSELNSFVRIAMLCVEDAAASRPSMGEVVKQLEELIGHDYPESGSSNIELPKGHDYPESGSSNIELPKGQPIHHPDGSDSQFMRMSSDSSDLSFPNSASNIPPFFGSRLFYFDGQQSDEACRRRGVCSSSHI